MFFVYGIGGQVFRGSAEQLRQIGGVSAVARSRAVLALKQDGNDPSDTFADIRQVAEAAAGEPVDHAHRTALAAYAEAQQVEHPPQRLYRVSEVMSANALTLSLNASVRHAWGALMERGVEQAPVIDESGVLVGLLCRIDLMRPLPGAEPEGPAPDEAKLLTQTVAQLMRTPVPSVAPEADIRWLARVLLESSLPGLPVVHEDGHVCGFVARADLVRAVATQPPLDLWG